jgi:hypothetical protein
VHGELATLGISIAASTVWAILKMNQAAPLRAVPEPIPDIGRISRLDIRRRDRLSGVIHEYRHAA